MNDIIEAISCEREIIQLKLLNVPKHPKMIAKIFSILKDEEIQEIFWSNKSNNESRLHNAISRLRGVFEKIEITLDQEFQLKLNQAIMKLKDEFKQIQIYQIRKYAKVAVGGKLVETTPGLAAEVFDVLGQANIHFYQITTSKRTISLVIDKKNLDQAIQLLKERFHIEEDK